MKSRWFLVVFLVLGLALITASAKATVNMVTEQLGNGAICYFEASESVSTVISIFNTDDNPRWVHVMVWNHKSQHLKDHPWKLSPNGTLVLQASYDSTSEKVIIKPIGGDALDESKTAYYDVTQLTLVPGTGADNIQEISTGVYGGYVQLVVVADETDVAALGSEENILYVTTALISEPNWWVGLPTYMLQIEDDTDLYQSGTGYIAKGAVKQIDEVNGVDATTGAILYGRWYASDTVKGTVVLVTPAKYTDSTGKKAWSDKITDVKVCDESQNCTSYPAIEIYEVTRNTDLLETAGDDFSDQAGWVELDNATMNTVGFILEEEAGKCDMLPMAKKEK